MLSATGVSQPEVESVGRKTACIYGSGAADKMTAEMMGPDRRRNRWLVRWEERIPYEVYEKSFGK